MTCPMCGAATEQKFRPFCSKRCADLDLAKWMDGSYAVPSDELEDVENAMKEENFAEFSDPRTTMIRH